VPFLRADEPPAASEPAEDALVAAEERDRALAELKELEFDHRTGKITDDDYRALIQPLRRRAAQTLANGQALSAKTPEHASEQQFSEHSLPSSRRDR
jgi:virulence-associated protein VagC